MIVAAIELAQAPAEIRVDTFDRHSRRTGYLIVQPRTGRVDHFDTRSNRLGHGYISPAPGIGSRDGDRVTRPGDRIDGNRR